MKNLHSQRGIGFLNLIFILVIVTFLATFAFKVIPIYGENRYVEAGLRDLVEPGTKLEQMSDSEIKKKMNNFYMLNNVRTEGPKNIVINRKSEHVIVSIDYESRTPFIYNIDLVVSFKNQLDSTRPNECCKPMSVK